MNGYNDTHYFEKYDFLRKYVLSSYPSIIFINYTMLINDPVKQNVIIQCQNDFDKF